MPVLPFGLSIAFVTLAGLVISLLRARWHYLALPELSAAIAPESSCDIIIPARNEAATIAAAVKAHGSTRVVVVNDNSTDDTSALAAAAGAKVVNLGRWRRGENGKARACALGASLTEGEYLCFVDADVLPAGPLVHAAAAFLQREEAELLTVFLTQRGASVWEQSMLPLQQALHFGAFLASRFPEPEEKESAAIGQCILVRRKPYIFFSGHNATINEPVDDQSLLRVFLRHQQPVTFARAGELASVGCPGDFLTFFRHIRQFFRRTLVLPTGYTLLLLFMLSFCAAWLPALFAALAEKEWAAALAMVLTPPALATCWYGDLRRAFLILPALAVYPWLAFAAFTLNTIGSNMVWKDRDI
jgi:hypothetical protein